MEGVFELYGLDVGEEKQLGEAKLSSVEYKAENENPLVNIRLMMSGNGFMKMVDGKYVRLIVGGQLMMSDTKMEKDTNSEFIHKANGRVFIAGLGIGLIVHNLREKVKTGEVTEIVVMEKSQDVVDLISPYFKDVPITYIVDDVLEYKPPKTELYDTIYFDIWPTIDTENLKEIAMLHQRWKNRRNRKNPKNWMGSRMQDLLKSKRREDNRGWW